MSNKNEIVNLTDVNTDLFVRRELDQDRVLYLAGLVENGVELEPIEITPDRRLIDGRHRKEAYELLGRTQCSAKIVQVNSEEELISLAYRANLGGSLPPSNADSEHTVMMLLQRDVARKQIAELLGIPVGLARTFINAVQAKLQRAKLVRAAASVTEDGLTVPKAAELHEVDIDRLKEFMSPASRRGAKKSVADIQRQLTFRYKSLSSQNASTLRGLLAKVEDGDVSPKQAVEIFDHYKRLCRQSSRAVSDWRSRFEAMIKVADEKAKAQAS